MDKKYKKLAGNTITVLIGNIGSKLITFLMLPYYTHYLSTDKYGEADVINTYATILVSFITFCVADAIFVYPSKENFSGKSKYFSSGLLFAGFTSLCFGLLAFILRSFGEDLSSLGTFVKDIWWIFGMAVSMFFQNYVQQFTMSVGKMKCYSITGVVNTLLIASFAFIFLPRWGLDGYLISIISANIVASLFNIIIAKLYQFFSLRCFSKSYLMNLLSYGIPLIPNSVMWWLVSGMNRPVLETTLGLSAVGIFAVSNKFPSVLSLVFNVFSNAWNVSAIDEFGSNGFNDFFNTTLKILTTVVLVVGVIISAFSKLIISVFADSSYADAWLYIPLLTLGVIFQCMSSFVGSVFMAEKKSKYFFYSSLWGALCSLVMTIVGIKLWGLIGAALAVVLSFLVMFIVRIKYAWPYINLFDIKFYILNFTIYALCILGIMTDISNNISYLISLVTIVCMALCNKDFINKALIIIKHRIK